MRTFGSKNGKSRTSDLLALIARDGADRRRRSQGRGPGWAVAPGWPAALARC